jgi:hypothetical protein
VGDWLFIGWIGMKCWHLRPSDENGNCQKPSYRLGWQLYAG